MDLNFSMKLTRRFNVFWCTPVSLVLMDSSMSSQSLAVCSLKEATQSATKFSTPTLILSTWAMNGDDVLLDETSKLTTGQFPAKNLILDPVSHVFPFQAVLLV